MRTALLIALAGTVAAPPPVPVPRPQTVPAAPGPFMVWEPGHWAWSGHGYDWVAGGYEVKDHGRHYGPFLPGHWVRGSAGWVWSPAHFQ